MKTDLTVGAYIVHDKKVLLIHHRKLDLWLPVGGHIEENETPDDALLREIQEEVGLSVSIVGIADAPLEGNVKRHMAVPFYTNVHSVGDHDHYCLFYVCIPKNPQELQINNEVKDAQWFSEQDLEHVPADVRTQALTALKFGE